MRISATIGSHPKTGAGQVVAKGAGRQRTVPYDHSRSVEQNYGDAAGTLALVLIQGETARKVAAQTAKVVKRASGKVTFSLGE